MNTISKDRKFVRGSCTALKDICPHRPSLQLSIIDIELSLQEYRIYKGEGPSRLELRPRCSYYVSDVFNRTWPSLVRDMPALRGTWLHLLHPARKQDAIPGPRWICYIL